MFVSTKATFLWNIAFMGHICSVIAQIKLNRASKRHSLVLLDVNNIQQAVIPYPSGQHLGLQML